MAEKSLTIMVMDGPYETENTTTAFRIISEAQQKGIQVHVFLYEGGVNLSVRTQKQHPNPVKGMDNPAENDHPTTKAWVESLMKLGVKFTFCGMCADERGTDEIQIEGVARGGPKDFWDFVNSTTNTLIIPTK